MNIRKAILKAADHIEANPRLFDFHEIHFPDCGTPGCALGWMAYFYGFKSGNVDDFAQQVLCLKGINFYERMSDIWKEKPKWFLGSQWQHDANECARCLRIYANRYHPAQPLTLFSELNRIFAATREKVAA